MLQLGIFYWFTFEIPLKERMHLIRQAGFDATCLYLGDDEPLVREGRADEMADRARDSGLTLDNVHAPFIGHYLLWSDSQDAVDKVRSELMTSLVFCHKHRIPRMVAHFNGKEYPPATWKGLQVIQDIVKQAEDAGIVIAAENTPVGNEYLDYIFDNIQSPNLRFCYDSSHDNIASAFRGETLWKWGHLLAVTHLSDNFGTDDDHLLPGKGNIDWNSVRNNFPANYTGTLMLEVDGPNANKGFTPEQFLWTGYEWLRQFASHLETENTSTRI